MSEPVLPADLSAEAVKRVGAKMIAALRRDKLGLEDVRSAAACVAVLLFEDGTDKYEKATAEDVSKAALALRAAQPLVWSALTAKAARGKRNVAPPAAVNLHRIAHSLAAHAPTKAGEEQTTAHPHELAAIVAALRS